MINKSLLTIISFLFIFSSCSHSVFLTKLNEPTVNKKKIPKILVYEPGDTLPEKFIVLGEVWLGESGFSTSCGYNDAIFLAKQKAREIGADAVVVTKVKKPNFFTTCYRVGANLIELK